MDFNFIEEVSKALDTLSVERLVRASPIGSVRCEECNKIFYTFTQARYIIIKMFLNENKYMDLYPCPVQGGKNYHVTDLQKRLDKIENEWFRRGIEQKKLRIDAIKDSKPDSEPQNLVIHYGRDGIAVSYSKNLRRKILRALAIPVHGLRKPRKGRLRRNKHPRRHYPRRDTTRFDLPRGEIMTKMLAWPNAKHWNPKDCAFRDGSDDRKLRRRNRAREAEAVRKLIREENHGQ